MKPQKEIIVNEILSEMDFGITYTESMALNGTKWQIPERTFARYWSEASTRYLAANESAKKAVEVVRVQEIEKRASKGILSREERIQILSEIARGEQPMVKHVVVSLGNNLGSEIQEVTVYPAWKDKRDAVAEINKMEGDYAPIKKDITSKGESLAPAPVFQIILDETDDDE